MADFKYRHWGQQLDALGHEISRLALVCDIELGQPGLAEKVLKNDDSVCRRTDPESFRKLRQHLMALFPLEEKAIERLGAADTKEILDQVRASVMALRAAGKPGSNQ